MYIEGLEFLCECVTYLIPKSEIKKLHIILSRSGPQHAASRSSMYCMLPNGPTQLYTSYFACENLLGSSGHVEAGMGAPDFVGTNAAEILTQPAPAQSDLLPPYLFQWPVCCLTADVGLTNFCAVGSKQPAARAVWAMQWQIANFAIVSQRKNWAISPSLMKRPMPCLLFQGTEWYQVEFLIILHCSRSRQENSGQNRNSS